MNVMCANLEFLALSWKWEFSLPSVHVYYKMLWETKYIDDYEMICTKLLPTLYQVLFGEEAPCLSPKGQAIVKEYGDWYMTPIKVYIRISRSTNPLHWLPHCVLDTLLLQVISYKTFVNVVSASLHRNKKGI